MKKQSSGVQPSQPEGSEEGQDKSPYPSEVTYKSDKNFLVRLKALIDKNMKLSGYKTSDEKFKDLIEKFNCAEDYLFESPSPKAVQSKEEMMPVHSGSHRLKQCPKEVPFSMLNEERAKDNHSQSLKRLKERGGMGVLEILDNIHDRKLSMRDENIDDVTQLNLIIENKYAAQTASPVSEDEIRYAVEEIFYSPATNGKAEESIQKGVEAIKRLLQSPSPVSEDDWPVQCSLDEQQCQQECKHKSNRRLCPFAERLPYKKEFEEYFKKYYPHLIPSPVSTQVQGGLTREIMSIPVEEYAAPASTEVELLNETIKNQHKLILSGEERGYQKAKEEFQTASPVSEDDIYKKALQEIIHTTASKTYTPFQKVDRCFGVAESALSQSVSTQDPFIEKHLAIIREKMIDNLIHVHIEGMGELEKASVEHFLETGKVNGSFYLRLKEILTIAYNWNKNQPPVSTQVQGPETS